MRFEKFSFGSTRIDGVTYEHDVVIDRGEVRKRKKKPSKKFRAAFGHTPLSVEEKIPWKCSRLVTRGRGQFVRNQLTIAHSKRAASPHNSQNSPSPSIEHRL